MTIPTQKWTTISVVDVFSGYGITDIRYFSPKKPALVGTNSRLVTDYAYRR
jgi:hypothetical protein